jgi:hypothetical protein
LVQDEKVGEVAFHFDKIFWPGSSQAEVYGEIAEPIVKGEYVGDTRFSHRCFRAVF